MSRPDLIGNTYRRTHGCARKGSWSPEYMSWVAMIQRCTNPKNPSYPRYGGRRITVCDRWMTFENFLADMGAKPSPKHSIERIDNDGHYHASNCRWATAKVQARNRRNNRLLTLNGKTLCVAAWAETLGISQWVLANRLRYGWSDERILTTPVRFTSPRRCTRQ